MKQSTNYAPLFLVVIFFIIGANYPSNGVDEAIYKTPGAIMHDTLKILSAAVFIVIIVKALRMAKSSND
ncbi:MAG: hypothetical protein ACXVNM_04940 [Bacteroidia bacterium]